MSTQMTKSGGQQQQRYGNQGEGRWLSPQQKNEKLDLFTKECDGHMDKLVAFCGDEATARKVVNLAAVAILKNDDLLKCTPSSLFMCLKEAVANGFMIGSVKPDAYLVPYGPNAQLIPSVHGYLKMVRNADPRFVPKMEPVFAGDKFEFRLGDDPKIDHVPSDAIDRDTAEVRYVYGIFKLASGEIVRQVWSKARIDAHKEQYSVAWRSAETYRKGCEKRGELPDPKRLSSWHTSWVAMAMKTIVKWCVNRGMLPIEQRGIEPGRVSLMDREDTIVAEPVEQLESHQEALEAPQQPKDVRDDQDDLWNRFEMALEDCVTLGALTAITEEMLPMFNEIERPAAQALADKTADRIRAEKAERAKA